MKRLSLLAIIVSAFGWPSLAPPAYAACSDVPAPDAYWRRCVFDRQDLTDVDLTGASLRDSSFKRADLSFSILQAVDARRAKFVTSIMRDVVLDDANLVRADLTKADLKGASLKGANLTWARMFRADLSGADLQARGSTIRTFYRRFWTGQLGPMGRPSVQRVPSDVAGGAVKKWLQTDLPRPMTPNHQLSHA